MHCLICPLWIPLQHLLDWGKKAPVRWTHCKWSRDPVALLHYPPMAFSIMTPKYRAREKTRLVFPNKKQERRYPWPGWWWQCRSSVLDDLRHWGTIYNLISTLLTAHGRQAIQGGSGGGWGAREKSTEVQLSAALVALSLSFIFHLHTDWTFKCHQGDGQWVLLPVNHTSLAASAGADNDKWW